jgi:sarcosine oxidase
MRVAVVGAGITGAAAAWALVRDGHDVVVYEQFEPGTARASSHGRSRIFRFAYTEPQWVDLARDALVAWRDVERETGETLLELDGLLELSPTVADSSRPVLDACGVAWSEVDPADYGVYGPDGWIATLQPDAGITRADTALRVFLDGIDVRSGVRVESLADLEADVVVVAAGPWARRLLERAGIELPVVETRETLAYFAHVPRVGAIVDRNADGHLMYALRDPLHGLKAGAHMSGVRADPDGGGAPDHALVERVAEWVRERIGDTELVGAETCWYTTTRDESFVLERHGPIVVASPCSGHAFKFAPLTGRRIAALVSNGQNPGPGPG